MICNTGVELIDSRVSVNLSTGCWLYAGPLGRDGRPRVMIKRKDGSRTGTTAYKVVWEFYNGKIQGGLELDHVCRVRHCVNPFPGHVEAKTHLENLLGSVSRSGDAMRRNICRRGHPYNSENTHTRKLKTGKTARQCRICHSDKVRRRRMKGD